MKKLAIFRFEASPTIGAGHAIRSCVLSDSLVEAGWLCKVVTTLDTYNFIVKLSRFERIAPEEFYNNPINCDLLVIDNYDLDTVYESHFRTYAKKIMVIDDLASRHHDCDILLDQTYGRDADDYKGLVPRHCEILAGSDYVLLRKEFIELRPKALEKRRQTTEIKRILVSMGGSDPKNYTLEALEMIKQSGFTGSLDIVLGFKAANFDIVKSYIDSLPNVCAIHVNADMPKLIYEADLAIGAAGSSVWERCCLGVPQYLFKIAENQAYIMQEFKKLGLLFQFERLPERKVFYGKYGEDIVDGFGANRVIQSILSNKKIKLRKVTKQDKNQIYKWQNNREIRKYFNNSNPPALHEHEKWFANRISQYENPYWIIEESNEDCGVVSLSYNFAEDYYDLSWYVIPEKWGASIGTNALREALFTVNPFKTHAFVKEENLASHNALKKAGFKKVDSCNYMFDHRCI